MTSLSLGNFLEEIVKDIWKGDTRRGVGDITCSHTLSVIFTLSKHKGKGTDLWEQQI